jgi:hypothetical protein
VVLGDDVSLDPTAGTADFASANVARLPNGTVIDQVVTASNFALTGVDQANYSLVMGTDDAKINPKSIDASFTTEDKVYDGTSTAAVLTRTLDPTDIVPGDEALVSLGSQGGAAFATADVARDVGGNVIDQVVTASGFQLAGTNAGNYDLTSVGTELAAITPKSIDGSFTADDKTYDGNADAVINTSSIDATDIVGTDDVVLDDSGASASFPDKAAGAARTVTSSGFALTGAQAGNYALAMGTATATINQLATDASFTAANKQYDGTAAATVTGVSFTDDVAGDALGLSGATTFNSAAVGNGKPVTMAAPALTGADAGNYVLGTVSGTTANITRRQVTGHFTAADKDYDGTTAARITGRSLSNKVSGETVSLIGGTATFGNANPGVDKFVSGTGFSLGGANAGNYTLASVATTTADIRQREPGGSTPPPKDVKKDAENALGGDVTELPFDLAGLGYAFAPADQTNTLKVGKRAIKLFAIGGCDAPCTVQAKKTLVLIGAVDGASAAAKTRKMKLKTQNLSLAAGEFGVIKLKKLTKKQRKAIRKAQKSKLVVKTTLTSGAESASFKKKYKLKLKK